MSDGTCAVCGEPVPPPSPLNRYRRRRICDSPSCFEEASRHGGRLTSTRNSRLWANSDHVDRTHYKCPKCPPDAPPKPLTREYWYVRNETAKGIARRMPDGTLIYFEGWCKECKRAKQRARTAELKKDPAKHLEACENKRIAYRLRKEREGRKVRELTHRTWAKNHGYGVNTKQTERLPAGPLVPLIKEWMESGETLTALAALADVSDKRLREIHLGHQDNVNIDTADKLCVALGLHLDDVYGYWGEGAMAA